MAFQWIVDRIRRLGGRRPRARRARPSCDVLEGRQLLASTILFNPTGSASTPTASIETLDFAAGSALAKGSLPSVVGQTFQLYYQATLVGAFDADGNAVSLPGLNSAYQITAVASFTEVVTEVNIPGGAVTFALAPVQAAESFYEIYYNPSVVANNLAGTGFNQGSRILLGRPSLDQFSSSNFALAPVQQNPLPPFDSFLTDNYPGVRSLNGLGSTLIGSDVVSLDRDFFVSPIAQLSFDTTTSTPFLRTNPSGLFVGEEGGAAPTIVPNVGAVNGIVGPDFQFQADANATFTLAAPAIGLTKATNGVPAPLPPGPIVAVGSTVSWTYQVTNPGNEPLRDVAVVDDAGTPSDPADDFAATFVSGDTNGDGLLDPSETWSYAASGIARAGQYENRAVATGTGTLSGTPVQAAALSHYFAPLPAIGLTKATNGVPAPLPPGPIVAVGSTVSWTYQVTNPGNEPLRDVAVVDDAGTPSDPADDFAATFVSGDTNGDGLLDPSETWSYAASGIARQGPYENRAVATGTGTLSGQAVNATDLSHYFAAAPAIGLTKATNGVPAPAPPGPTVPVGSTVSWTYQVTNPGNEPLRDVAVVDDAGTPSDPADDFAATFVSGDTNGDGLLDPSETWSYAASGIARQGPYENRAVATGTGTLSGTPVQAAALSHYTTAGVSPGQVAVIGLTKLTNGQLAPSPTGPVVFVGTTVTFTYLVTNPGNVPLNSVSVFDDNGTPGNLADDFLPTFVGGDVNGNALLDPGETWTYTASRVATLGQYSNVAAASGFAPNGTSSVAVANSNHLGICPMVVDVRRTGVHLQRTRIVVTFDGPLDPALAEDVRNYRITSLGPDGRFSIVDRVTSAEYDPTTNSVTLTLEDRLNLHHLSRIQVTNPCPGGPGFDGVLNRKYSLGEVTIVGERGHRFVFPRTDAPKVLNTSLLPRVLTPSNRAAVNRLSLRPRSSAFAPVMAASSSAHPASPADLLVRAGAKRKS